MTTNNHPAHGPVSLDRLHQIREILSKASAQSDGGNLGYAMADAVKVIDGAIAARNVETIYQVMYGECWRDITEEQYHDHAIHESPIRIVYTAPPAPVVPEWTNEQCLEFLSIAFRHAEIKGDLELDDIRLGVKMVNGGRAAMLQAGNHTEQNLDMVDHSGDANEKVEPVIKPYKLPFDQWLSQQNEPIDVDCGCVTTEAFYHWLRVAYEASNSPVAPDGYVLVPKEPTAEMINSAMRDNETGGVAEIYDLMITAAPQQEVK
ncbi:hypothetical protein ACV8S1_20065 [Citrobacter braakii]